MTVIKTSYVVSGNPEVEDQELPAILYRTLGMTFYKFVEITLDKVGNAIKGKRGKQLYVRCFRTEERKCGWCFKTGGGSMPDIVVGFLRRCRRLGNYLNTRTSPPISVG